ncbi:DNA mismatch repair protein MutS [candidate division KSB1 bacterium]|nr:DNA mismatch repair protein MutS [candidate division KSB1 bacterium]
MTSISTPLIEQYLKIKAQHKGAVLFFRMGDFYEMFYDDAKIASKVLGITLTSRAHGKAADVPLAGFPYHALESYLAKFIKAGYKVAICEQVEDPKLAKGIVKREVIEVVTAGTSLFNKILETKKNNFLMAVYLNEQESGLAFLDLSTGEFSAGDSPLRGLFEAVRSIEPSEILIPEGQRETFDASFKGLDDPVITPLEDYLFSQDFARETLIEHFKTQSLKGFGIGDLRGGIPAAGAIMAYVRENQPAATVHITRLSRHDDSEILWLDATTRRNLELTETLWGGGGRGTLLGVLDHTRTAMGGRLIKRWLIRPLRKLDVINQRLDGVAQMVDDHALREELAAILIGTGDLERLITRISAGRANPREVIQLEETLAKIPLLKKALKDRRASMLNQIGLNLGEFDDLTSLIEQALVADPPLALNQGGLFKKGYNRELDELRVISSSGKDWILALQRKESKRTGIHSLKVGYNRVFGYYLEITRSHLSKVPPEYIRRQTLVNAERFITPELKEYEEKVLNAEERIYALEYELFCELREKVALRTAEVQQSARLIAQLDCLLSLVEAAVRHDYHRPQLNLSDKIHIEESRHPVVELLLPPGEKFIPNDVTINTATDQILIVTGPNMAGKSTYLRQVGLIVIMAQMGSFVPAKRAEIGLVDKIFTRVGATDNLAGGESTFLVEMNETANILNNATPKSLILLDEIGRGTSTFDGLSIAWSVAEYLHNTPRVAAKTLFATHYHELTELELIMPRVKNYNVEVREWGDEVVFLRKIVPGGCDHSYGIQVARLAGLPPGIIDRAKEVLQNLEENELTVDDKPKLAAQKKPKDTGQLDIFAAQENALRDIIEGLEINKMTPLEAIQKLDEMKKMLKDSGIK